MLRAVAASVCVLIAGCSESVGGLGALDAAVVDVAVSDAAVGADAGDPRPDQPGIQVRRINGEPAVRALVYAVEDSQGELLGRTDLTGFFAIDQPGTTVLVRLGFGEAGLEVLRPDGFTQVDLRSTESLPKRLQIFGVGMESLLYEGAVDQMVAFEQWALGMERGQSGLPTIVHVDAQTGDSRTVFETAVTRNREVRAELVRIDERVAVYFVASGLTADQMTWSLAVINVETGAVLHETRTATATNPQFVTDAEGDVVVVRAQDQAVGLSFERFEVAGTLERVEVSTGAFAADVSAGHEALGLSDGTVYFRSARTVFAGQLGDGAVRAALTNVPDGPRCLNTCWVGPSGVHRAQVGRDKIVYQSGRETVREFEYRDLDGTESIEVASVDDFAIIVADTRPLKRYFVVNPPRNDTDEIDFTVFFAADELRLLPTGTGVGLFAPSLGPHYYDVGALGGARLVRQTPPGGENCWIPDAPGTGYYEQRRWLACTPSSNQFGFLYKTEGAERRSFTAMVGRDPFTSSESRLYGSTTHLFITTFNPTTRAPRIYSLESNAPR